MGSDIHGRMEVKIGNQWFAEMEIPTFQDYDFFGILAGVRNYANVEPISWPKGIPPDVSDKVQQEIEEWGGHSHSYLTLKEFDEYDWDAESEDGRTSVIEKSTGKELYKARYTVEMNLSREELSARDRELKHLKRRCRDFLTPTWIAYFELMRAYSPDDPENVRIVFWFDG